jgi:hypothetical protein
MPLRKQLSLAASDAADPCRYEYDQRRHQRRILRVRFFQSVESALSRVIAQAALTRAINEEAPRWCCLSNKCWAPTTVARTQWHASTIRRWCWHVEHDLHAIKTFMQMDILRCKTIEMVEKEITAHLLAYNLVRPVMAQAALGAKRLPRQ